jgi:type I restriction enzyme R subunit
VFEKIIVITDRQVRDRQLQAQVKAFEQVPGTVREINDSSKQLREALEGEQARIIISTLQKFPFVLAQLTEAGSSLKERTYAVIVDEAHSSQTGESAVDLKAVLGSRQLAEPDDDDQDDGVPELLRRLAARGVQPNLSFFAFTATPKPRTNEVFGTVGIDKLKRAFHTYSMRQAIEEDFIVDVLKNYTSYEEAMRLEGRARQVVELPKNKASGALTRYARFHPYLKAQKAVVVLDHFERVVRAHVGGEAKAMVVTAGREEAVQWRLALDAEILRRKSRTRTLVAFSGEVTITHPEAKNLGSPPYTESGMNVVNGRSLPEKRLPEEFDKPEYGVLVVAEKYQTGFDQPKLVAMYVDKTLTGVNSVQTLSRLNRTHPLKTDTFVLDFVNDPERIRKDFEPFYGRTEAVPTHPNVLFDAKQQLLDRDVIHAAEVAFAAAWFVPHEPNHAVLSGLTQAAFERAARLDENDLEQFRDDLDRFVRFYSFLSQIVPYLTEDSERFIRVRPLPGAATARASRGRRPLRRRLADPLPARRPGHESPHLGRRRGPPGDCDRR